MLVICSQNSLSCLGIYVPCKNCPLMSLTRSQFFDTVVRALIFLARLLHFSLNSTQTRNCLYDLHLPEKDKSLSEAWLRYRSLTSKEKKTLKRISGEKEL